MEVCDRYSTKAMHERANSTVLNNVAPKDVKQLEVLRPHSIPSMGKRYNQSLEKEKTQQRLRRMYGGTWALGCDWMGDRQLRTLT